MEDVVNLVTMLNRMTKQSHLYSISTSDAE